MKDRLENIENRIKQSAIACGRPDNSVKLVAVSKTMPEDVVEEAIGAGVKILGENYIQEAVDKISSLSDYDVSWHFIGHLQSKKSKFAVKYFDLIHSVDSLKLAKEINKQAEKIGKVQDILVQVNISGEETKSGTTPEGTEELIVEISKLPNVTIRGLMTMPPFFNDPESAQPYFSSLRDLSEKIKSKSIPNVHMDELSMGMTGDFEVAIQEGATLVRVGTAIFGKRK